MHLFVDVDVEALKVVAVFDESDFIATKLVLAEVLLFIVRPVPIFIDFLNLGTYTAQALFEYEIVRVDLLQEVAVSLNSKFLTAL